MNPFRHWRARRKMRAAVRDVRRLTPAQKALRRWARGVKRRYELEHPEPPVVLEVRPHG